MKKFSLFPGLLLLFSTAFAQHHGDNPVHAMSAWSRALPPVSENGAVYLTLKNYSETPDRLLGASSQASARVEIHTHTMKGELMTMRRVESVVLNPGEYVSFEPGGLHLMLIGLKRPLKEGEQFPLILQFERAPALELVVEILPPGASGPGMAGHEHSKAQHYDKDHGHDMSHGQKQKKE